MIEFSNKREQTIDTCKTMDASQKHDAWRKALHPFTHIRYESFFFFNVLQQAKFIHDGKKKRLKELLVSAVETGRPLREFYWEKVMCCILIGCVCYEGICSCQNSCAGMSQVYTFHRCTLFLFFFFKLGYR